ncbi:hypothetical protein [Kordia sp.]|uniref:hypothetical protein n=1 Tax=Kordia sp. TaxID=1965332 RepID=UPI0025C0932C|nr:hypothetical protein [Kordia sp.]MCH2194316.1 hypothetical protein [Kordia sp.]
MNLQTKQLLLYGVISGIIFAVMMAGFDYFNGEEFSGLKFIIHASLFGFFMAITDKYILNKKKKGVEKE